MNRIDKDEYYLNIAKQVSKRSTCLKRRYGAVIVNNDEIIATGYNGSPRGEENCCDKGYCERLKSNHPKDDYSDCNSVHAEQNALISAARKDMINGTLYLYGEDGIELVKLKDSFNPIVLAPHPCHICRRMIKNAGIKYIKTLTETIEL